MSSTFANPWLPYDTLPRMPKWSEWMARHALACFVQLGSGVQARHAGADDHHLWLTRRPRRPHNSRSPMR